MKRLCVTLTLAAVVVLAALSRPSAQYQVGGLMPSPVYVPIVTAQAAGTVNATTTRTSTTMIGSDAAFLLNITAGGASTGIVQIFVEDSLDGGFSWNDLAAFAPFTFGGSPTTQTLLLYGRTDGPGLIRSITGAVPSAGAEISETAPAGSRWELLAFAFSLTTSATVANRAEVLTLDDGANVFWRVPMNVNQTAGATWNYVHAQGFGSPTISQVLGMGAMLPINNRLAAGYRIKTVTAAIQTGDQYTAPQYVVREWRDLPTRAQTTESFPAGQVRSGPWGDRIRVREVVSNISGSPIAPTYSLSAVLH